MLPARVLRLLDLMIGLLALMLLTQVCLSGAGNPGPCTGRAHRAHLRPRLVGLAPQRPAAGRSAAMVVVDLVGAAIILLL